MRVRVVNAQQIESAGANTPKKREEFQRSDLEGRRASQRVSRGQRQRDQGAAAGQQSTTFQLRLAAGLSS